MTTIHLIFKTHLDIGFTDYSASVVQTYYDRFIPQAVALARRTRHDPRRFRWTTGAWLIYTYLEQASPEARREMEDAIAAGDIRWHALPFTTHTELIDESLWRFGLGYSRALDKRFGLTTIAAKLTDVPGHTRALVPLLAESGVRLLHLGVNPASRLPEVPPVFLWRDSATDTDVIVIYNATYGDLTQIDGLDDALALTLTGDNEGPPTDAAIASAYASLAERVPGASVVASTLDDFARKLDSVRDHLPVITAEIGDTWIHGAGTDPTKVSRYRELARLRREWLSRPGFDADSIAGFSGKLLMVPEHTWGMDEKTHLPDHRHYLPDDFAVLRQSEAARRFEASWAEQRAYLNDAVAALPDALAQEAQARLNAIAPKRPALAGLSPLSAVRLGSAHFEAAFDPQTGALSSLTDTRTGAAWADADHRMALPSYEIFSSDDYQRFWEQYIRNKDDEGVQAWAREDFTKPGLPIRQHQRWTPSVTTAYQDGDSRAVFALAWPDEAKQFGAPAESYLEYTLQPDGLEITYAWFGKPATRLAEAFWLSFQPLAPDLTGWRLEKIGQMVEPRDVVSRGARTLHAVDQRVVYVTFGRIFTLETLDAPLVAPGRPSLTDFHNHLPDMRGGVQVNLYNNVWGTNFPMWFGDDAQFRFRLRVGGERG
jgi:hypothetical protein